MATTIITKNGLGVPTDLDLQKGELGLDLQNNKLYSKNDAGSVVQIAADASTLGGQPPSHYITVDNVGSQSVSYSNITNLPSPTVTLTGTVTGTGTMSELGSVSITTSITGYNKTNWDTAYSWGNHASAGYLTSSNLPNGIVVDGDFANAGIMVRGATSGSYTTITDNSNNWNTAYSWGNHASAGYLTAHPSIAAGTSVDNTGGTVVQDVTLDSNGHITAIGSYNLDNRYFTETEVNNFFSGTTAKTGYNKTNWDMAYGWGNHALAGYVTAASLNNPLLDDDFQTAGLMKTDGAGGYSSITDNSSNWNTAYSWGNHANAGYLTSQISHADVVVDGDFTSNGIMKRTGAGTYGIVTDNSTNWNAAYSWGNHATQGYLTAHPDITQAANVSLANGNVVNALSFDANGHVISTGSVNLDGRYYTENEVDVLLSAKAPTASPTFTGAIQLGSWDIMLDGNDLVFNYGGTDVFKITTTGAVIAKDNMTAYGAP